MLPFDMPAKQLRVDVLTIFPDVVDAYVNIGMLARAKSSGKLAVTAHDLRTWTDDPHHRVDDRPFGGGAGMVMQVPPIHKALISLKLRTKKGTSTAASKKTRIIVTSAKGTLFTQRDAERLSQYDRLVFICGRYEGIDERVAEHLADEELSIGPDVLTGGELPALVMTDAIARLRPGVLGAEESLHEESWGKDDLREYPQYTRPEKYLDWDVPPVLLSGDHQKIKEWRKNKKQNDK